MEVLVSVGIEVTICSTVSVIVTVLRDIPVGNIMGFIICDVFMNVHVCVGYMVASGTGDELKHANVGDVMVFIKAGDVIVFVVSHEITESLSLISIQNKLQ